MKIETAGFLKKSRRAIHAAELLLREGEHEFAAGRAYYAMFYAAEALLSEAGLRFRKHAGVTSAFGEHFAKTGRLDPKFHRWLLDGFDKRIQGDYGFDAVIDSKDVELMMGQAKEFLAQAESLLKQG